MKQIFDSPYLRILHDATYRVLEMQWQEATSAQFREGMLLGISQSNRLGVHTWLVNLQNMQTLAPQDQEWVYEKWFPRFAVLGIRRIAVIEPKDPLNHIGIMQVMQHEASTVPLATAYFLTVEEARKWSYRRYTDFLIV